MSAPRSCAVLASVVAVALALAGCGGSPNSQSAPPDQNGPIGTAPDPSVKAGRGMPAFALPAPSPSARTGYPRELLPSDPPSLAAAAKALEGRLRAAGYEEMSFFRAPGGFALTTRMERIRTDGSPQPGAGRWAVDAAPLISFSGPVTLSALAGALFNADPGTYRILVFVVTDRPVTVTGGGMQSDVARRMIIEGVDDLPEDFEQVPFGLGHRITVLVYQFSRTSVGKPAEFSSPSQVPARRQLQLAGLL